MLGAHFAPAQGGSAFTSAAVGALVQWMSEARGGDVAAATGQSSWGPTGFVIVPTQAKAEALVRAARAADKVTAGLDVCIVSARNQGATFTERAGLSAAPPTA